MSGRDRIATEGRSGGVQELRGEEEKRKRRELATDGGSKVGEGRKIESDENTPQAGAVKSGRGEKEKATRTRPARVQ